MIYEIIGLIPVALILDFTGTTEPLLLLAFLRLNRVILIFRMPGILAMISSRYPRFMKYIAFFKPTSFLFFVWHFSSCIWIFFNLYEIELGAEKTWSIVLEQDKLDRSKQYFFAIHFTMNIATTTGYPEQISYNNAEKIFYIIMAYIGSGLFAVGFGMVAANSRTLP
mmetsp:Transcript_26557/g.23538  ORF Transcript_26557/g.23538 Transcript_26557/m.23538 type:complete len:167 (+) Transcript_26557:2048-2548(+)